MYRGSLETTLRSLDSWIEDLQAAGLAFDIPCLTALINVSTIRTC